MAFLEDIFDGSLFNREKRVIKKVAKATKWIILPFNPIPGINPVPNPSCYSVIDEIFDINSDIKFDRNQIKETITSIINKYNALEFGMGFPSRSVSKDEIFDEIAIFPGQGSSINYDKLKNTLSKSHKYFFQFVPGFGATGLASGGDYFAFYLAIALHTLLRENIRPLTEEKILGRMKYLSSFSDYK